MTLERLLRGEKKMTFQHENLIFFDKNSETLTWVNGKRKTEVYYHAIHTVLHKDIERRTLPISEMKFYFKRRGRNADK